MAKDTRYLTKRGKWFWCQVSVPRHLADFLPGEYKGKRLLLQYLRTTDQRTAEIEKLEHVKTFKQAIRYAQAQYLKTPDALDIELRQATSMRDELIARNASEIERHLEAHIAPGRRSPGAAQIVLGHDTAINEHLPAFLNRLVNRTYRTQEGNRHAIEMLIEWIKKSGEEPLVSTVTKQLAHEYIDEQFVARGLVKASIRKHSGILDRYWQFLQRQNVAEDNPFEKILTDVAIPEPREEKSGVVVPYTSDELRTLLTSTKNQLIIDNVMISLLSGLRRGEIWQLKAGDIRHGCIFIRKGKTYSARRVIPIHTELVQTLQRLTSGKAEEDLIFVENRIKKDGKDEVGANFGRLFSKYKRRVLKNSPQTNFHSLRHTFAHKLHVAGVPEATAAALLGHRHKEMSYGHYGRLVRMFNAREIEPAQLDEIKLILGPAVEKVTIANGSVA